MSLSPEIRKIPQIIGSFNRAGLTGELVGALIRRETGRNLVEDARKLMTEFGAGGQVNVTGLENLPKNSGCLVVFNHPNMDVLLPAMLTFIVQAHEAGGRLPIILMGGEIPLLGKFNQTFPLPGSIALMRRFHQIYSANFISVPISTTRHDYRSGRFAAVKKALAALRGGHMVMIAPEGHVEMNNTISPVSTLHSGSGGLSIIASKRGIPTVPIGIWEAQGDRQIHVNIGQPFMTKTGDNKEAVRELMAQVAQVLPNKFRGSFQ